MRNTPSKSPGTPALWQRLAIFAVLGCLPSCDPYTPESYLDRIDNTEETETKTITRAIAGRAKENPKIIEEVGNGRGKKLLPICKTTPKPSPFLKGSQPAEPVCVVDGDTFDVSLKKHGGRVMRVRLRDDEKGIDCPESRMNEKCMRKGKKACKKEVKNGKRATSELRHILYGDKGTLMPPYNDNGNRKLAGYRMQNGVRLSRVLIKRGLCGYYKK